MKETKILVAGFGGQGILLLGRLIAYAGMLEAKEVTCFPAYGAEVRGGTANSTVIFSDELIGSPIVKNPDILVVMNGASLKKFQPKVVPDGLLIFDSSLISDPDLRPDLRTVGVPASEMAASSDNKSVPQKKASLSGSQVRSANMVMLGALVAATGILKVESAMTALEKLTAAKRRESVEGNKEAILKGIKYIEEQKSKDS